MISSSIIAFVLSIRPFTEENRPMFRCISNKVPFVQQRRHISSLYSSPPIWFQLLDSATGNPYKGTTADKVSVASSADVADFRDAVKAKNFNKLSSVDAADLLVYKNKPAFFKIYSPVDEGTDEPLEEDSLIDGLGSSMKDALVVVVPSSGSSDRSTSESSLIGTTPNPIRKRRWIELNKILEGNAKKPKSDNSTAYSYVTWNQVKSVFNPRHYVQPRQEMDDVQLDFLAQYLSFATKCFRNITAGNDAKRLHFIAPILLSVCNLLDGDVDIVVEEDLTGNFIKAHGHFEFMLRRGNKAVCIVLAKKDDLEQGMAQDLVGCEVAAEVGGLDIVYGIVTNYIQWNFLRSLDDKVEMEECSLRLTPNGPERESLREITEKIYSMLK